MKIFKNTILILILAIVIFNTRFFFQEEQHQANIMTASNFYDELVNSNNISSFFALSEMYEKGFGVKKNLIEAKKFYIKAITSITPTLDNYDIGEYENSEISEVKKSIDTMTSSLEISVLNNNLDQVLLKNKQDSLLEESRIQFDKEMERYKQNTITTYIDEMPVLALMSNQIENKTLQDKTENSNFLEEPEAKEIIISGINNKALNSLSATNTTLHNQGQLEETFDTQPDNESIMFGLEEDKIENINSNALPTNSNDIIEYYEEGEYSIEELPVTPQNTDNTSVLNKLRISKFTGNPCTTASSHYIARCRRINRKN